MNSRIDRIKIVKAEDLVSSPTNHKQNNAKQLFKKIIIPNGEIVGLLQFATAEFNPGDVIKIHSHESMTEVFYLISGELNLISDAKVYSITSGDSFIIPPLNKHSLQFLQKSKIIYFNLPIS